MAAQTTDPVRRLLLLGGPVGPFFTLLARALGRRGWRVERCVFNLGDRLFGLGGAVALTPYHGFESKIPQALKDRVAAAEAKIKSGELKVPVITTPTK